MTSTKVAFGLLLLVCLLYLSIPNASCDELECYGIPAYDPMVCSGNGTCIAMDYCECFGGFSGDECEIPSCFGLNATDPDVCSGHGDCVALDLCYCDGEYDGNECEIPSHNMCSIELEVDTHQTALRSDYFVLDVDVSIDCDEEGTEFEYIWEQTSGETAEIALMLGSYLIFEPYAFPHSGSYSFELTVRSVENHIGSSVTINVDVKLGPLFVGIKGGNRKVSNIRKVKLEAVYIDTEDQDEVDKFTWSCDANGESCPKAIDSVVQAATKNVLELPVGIPAGEYEFKISYSKGARNAKPDSVKLTVVGLDIPEVAMHIATVFEHGDSFDKVIPKRDLEIVADIPSGDGVTTQWYINGAPVTTSSKIKVSKKRISILKSYFSAENQYIVRVTATNSAGTSFAEVTLITNAPPSGGAAKITPASGTALTTQFTLAADKNWVDDENSKLRYAWYFYDDNELITSTRPSFEPTLVLPLLPMVKSATSNMRIVLRVLDKHNDYATYDLSVTLTPATFGSENEKLDKLMHMLDALPELKSLADLDKIITVVDSIATALADNRDVKSKRSIASDTQPSKERIAAELLEIITNTTNKLEQMEKLEEGIYTQVGQNLLNIIATGYLPQDSKVSAMNFVGKLVESMVTTKLNIPDEMAKLFMDNIDKLATVDVQKSEVLVNKIMTLLAMNKLSGVASEFVQSTMIGSTIKLAVDDISGYKLTLPAGPITNNKQASVTFPAEVASKLSAAGLTQAVVRVKAYDASVNPHPYSNTATSSITTSAVSIDVLDIDGKVQTIANLAADSGITFTIPATIDTTKVGFDQHCRFFNEMTSKWVSDDTCKTVSFKADQIECQCSHLTLFAGTSDEKNTPPPPPTPPKKHSTNLARIIVPAVVVPVGVGLIVLVTVAVVASIVVYVVRSKKTNYQNGDIEMRESMMN